MEIVAFQAVCFVLTENSLAELASAADRSPRVVAH